LHVGEPSDEVCSMTAKRAERARAVEKPALRIGQAAALLGVAVETLRRWEEEGQLHVVRSQGGQRLVDIDTVRGLLARRRAPQRPIARSSARNQLEAVVLGVRKGRAAATVEMQAGPYRLVSLMTAEAVEELRLEPGVHVIASVKATSVVVGRPEDRFA
jgi:molybdopterin-binding protein